MNIAEILIDKPKGFIVKPYIAVSEWLNINDYRSSYGMSYCL